MGAVTTTGNFAVPAHLADRIGRKSALAENMAAGIGGGVDYARISIKGGRFRIIEGGTEMVMEGSSIEVITVGVSKMLTKKYYVKAWNPDAEPTAPDCYSLDGVRPAADSGKPQNEDCATCPHNVWGSKITPQGTKVKACPDEKRMAVVSADDPSGPIYLLTVTPSVLTDLKQYQKLLSSHGASPEIVRTIVSFDTTASFPKLKFARGDYNDDATQQIIDSRLDSDEVKHILGEDVPQTVAALPARAKPKAIVQQTVEVIEPEEVEVEAAPVAEPAPAKRGFGAKAVAVAPAAAAAPARRGFGAKAVAAEVVAPAAKPKAAAKAEPAVATKVLAADIEKLLAEEAEDAADASA